MMNVQIDQLVKTLLQKDSIEQCSLQELQQYADRHPYFGAAQLLLTKKLQTADPVLYEEQLQKTYLFFHNPLWVEHLLNENGTANITNGREAAPKPAAGTAAASPTGAMTHDETAETAVAAAEPEILLSPVEANQEEIAGSVDTSPLPSTAAADTNEVEKRKEQPAEANAHTDTGTDMLFQPYHTVDYFASQGIKVREDEKPVDKFGKQLKSFTDWLKTMKRLPVSEVTKHIDRGSEHKVEILAEHSLEDREVVTEAMAAVWEKQKNYEKAIAIYRKLSLLDPPKSAYFAAKIEDLKKFN